MMRLTFRDQAQDRQTIALRLASTEDIARLAQDCTGSSVSTGPWSSLQAYLDEASKATTSPLPYYRPIDVVWWAGGPGRLPSGTIDRERRLVVTYTGNPRRSGGYASQAYVVLGPPWNAVLRAHMNASLRGIYITGAERDRLFIFRQEDIEAEAGVQADLLSAVKSSEDLSQVDELRTEAESQTKVRIGQQLFRKKLLVAWNGRCPITGISHEGLLRASHIVPWAECVGDVQRLDPNNGILLSALWDAAFDKGLISFKDEGTLLISRKLDRPAREALQIKPRMRLRGLRSPHHRNLAFHRERHGF